MKEYYECIGRFYSKTMGRLFVFGFINSYMLKILGIISESSSAVENVSAELGDEGIQVILEELLV